MIFGLLTEPLVSTGSTKHLKRVGRGIEEMVLRGSEGASIRRCRNIGSEDAIDVIFGA